MADIESEDEVVTEVQELSRECELKETTLDSLPPSPLSLLLATAVSPQEEVPPQEVPPQEEVPEKLADSDEESPTIWQRIKNLFPCLRYSKMRLLY